MEDYKIEANEQFFDQVLDVLNEGGKWVWKNHPENVFTKQDGQLVGDDLSMVSLIVSPEFLSKKFKKI